MNKFLITFLIFANSCFLFSENKDSNQPMTRAAPTQSETALEQNLATLAGEPSAFVNGCVNAITGTFMQSGLDIYVPGPQPLIVQRSYTNMSGWCINEPERLESHGTSVVTHFQQGMISTFSEKSKKFTIREENFRKGLTNCFSGSISGRNNPHAISLSGDKREKKFKMVDGSKSVKKFDKPLRVRRKTGKTTSEIFDVFAISFEQKSSGIRTQYDYVESPFGWGIKSISNINSVPQILNTIQFEYDSNFAVNPCITALANQSQSGSCKYHFAKPMDPRFLKQISSSRAPAIYYEYDQDTGFMKRIMKPGKQVMEVDYYDETNQYQCVKNKDNACYGRVYCLRAPAGGDEQLHVTHSFIYEIHGDKKSHYGTTRVLDAHGQETRYSYDLDGHLKNIEEIGPKSRMSQFYWYGKKTDFDGNLMTKLLRDGRNEIFSCRHYIYDKNGNVLQDLLYGSLTGRSTKTPVINGIGAPQENGCERYLIKREYSQDGYNHVLNENDGRLIIKYVYTPKTDFLSAKFVCDQSEKIRYREFYEYDLNGMVTRIIADDGSSQKINDLNITERHITHIHYREQLPIGLPQIIEEKYLDLSSKKEFLISKIVNMHDAFGNLIQQDHYDANDHFRYSLKWEFDDHGNMIKEVDPLGYTSTYAYDENDRLIFEQHPGNPYSTKYKYDCSNRLICSEDEHPTFTLKTSYKYDLLGQKIASIDWHGHVTNYVYDRLGRLTQILYPYIYNEDNSYHRPTEIFEYDVANNPISITDQRGFCKEITYNIRGQPCSIKYSDGSTESNEYTLDGLLEKNVMLNGSSNSYQYDYLGRSIKCETHAPNGELLIKTSCNYNYFHKLSEIDPSGQITEYKYDFAGRLICTSKGDTKKCYEYDSCQRLAKTLEYFGSGKNDYIATVKDYDIMDRVVEERIEDADGSLLKKIGYVYNERGECIQTLTYLNATPDITTTHYHAYGDPEMITDPQGNVTRNQFYFDYTNLHGQSVFAQETIDAMGNTLFVENDPLGNIKFEMRKDNNGVVKQKREFFYDPAGNCIKHVDHVIASGQSNRQVTHLFEYDSNNQLSRWIEAFGTPEQKQTHYLYNPYQQKEKVIKSDHVELIYSYDWLGRLETFKASDDSFHYQYFYDANSNVIQVKDFVYDVTTDRVYDSHNRLIQEKLANDLTTQYNYDNLGRITRLTLPDQSTVEYKYQSLHLSKVKRGNYIHTYQKYNLSGLVEKAQMMGNLGTLQYTIDSCQRLVGIKTKKWKEEIPSNGFDKVGNLLKKMTTDSVGSIQGIFSYSPLYQLEKEKGVSEHTFKHDSLFNIIKKDKKEHKINALNQLLHDGFEKNCYDASGNLIQKGQLQLSYDALNRLTTVIDGQKKISYIYDEMNRRISSTYEEKGKQKRLRYFYQGKNEIGACDEEGQVIQLRILGLGKGAELAASVLFELEGKAYVPVHDIAGNICALFDPEKSVAVETYHYSAFGEEEIYDVNKKIVKKSINPWRFSSKRTDEETAFVYFGHRYYNPATSRWITADPLGLDAGPNLYAYLFNNPLNNSDLYGLEKSFGEDRFNHHSRLRDEGFWQSEHRYSESEGAWAREKVGTFKNTVRSTFNLIGKAIELTGFHVCFIPVLTDGVQFIGHITQGNNLSDYKMSYSRQKSTLMLISEGSVPGIDVLHINGVNVSLEEAKLASWDIAARLDFQFDVYLSYNATHGIVGDLIESGAQSLGIWTHSTQVFKEACTILTAAVGDYGICFLNGHSQGGIIMYDGGRSLPNSVTSKIDAFTLGSPVALPDGMYRNVENVTASWDVISWGTRAYNGVKRTFGGKAANINVVKTERGVLGAHFYNKSTYQKAVNDRLSSLKL